MKQAQLIRLLPTVLVAGLGFSSLAIAAEGTANVTYTKDVAPILFKACVDCHRPTMFAPMSLMTYDEVRPWARAIKQRVLTRNMPPWHADGPVGVFKNDPRLSEAQIDTIKAWVDAGAPKGADKDMPPTPTFSNDGWTIGKPDAVLSMATEYQIPADGTVPYLNFRIPTNFAEDKWMQAYEFRPQQPSPRCITSSPQSHRPMVRPRWWRKEWAASAISYRAGLVWSCRRVWPSCCLRTQTLFCKCTTRLERRAGHRPHGGGAHFSRKNRRNGSSRGAGVTNLSFVIPANDPNFEVRTTSRKLTEDGLLWSMMPHMHVRGKDMTYIAHYPDGRSETLLSVPHYDFNWQTTYELKEPKLLPKGTVIEVIAHYDNSTRNKYNPDPTHEVRWGDQTWEEMMIGTAELLRLGRKQPVAAIAPPGN